MKKSFAKLLGRFSMQEMRPSSQQGHRHAQPYIFEESNEEACSIDEITQGIQVFSAAMEALLKCILDKEDILESKITRLKELLLTIREQIDRTAESTTLVWEDTIDHNLDALDGFVQQLSQCGTGEEAISIVSNQIHERANILLRVYTKQITEYLRGEDEIGEEGGRPKTPHSRQHSVHKVVFDPFDEGVLRPKLETSLLHHHHGVAILLSQTKRWSKFMRNVLLYLEKRSSIVADYEKKLASLAQSHMSSLEMDDTFPCKKEVQEMYSNHIEYSQRMLAYMTGNNAQLRIEALAQLRTQHDRQRKYSKEMWGRSSKRTHDTNLSVSKLQTRYFSAASEWDKALTGRQKSQSSLYKLKLEKRMKEEAETRTRLVETRALYQKGIEDYNSSRSQHIRVRNSIISDLTGVLFDSSQAVRDCIIQHHTDLHKVHVALHIETSNLLERTSSYRPAPDVVETIARFGGFTISMEDTADVNEKEEDDDEEEDEVKDENKEEAEQAQEQTQEQEEKGDVGNRLESTIVGNGIKDGKDIEGDEIGDKLTNKQVKHDVNGTDQQSSPFKITVRNGDDDDDGDEDEETLSNDEDDADRTIKPQRESVHVVHTTMVIGDDEDSEHLHHRHHQSMHNISSSFTNTASSVAAAIGIGGKERRATSLTSAEDMEVLPNKEFQPFMLCDSARQFLTSNQLPNLCLSFGNEPKHTSDISSDDGSKKTATAVTFSNATKGPQNLATPVDHLVNMHAFTRLNYPTKCKKCKRSCYFNSVICNKCNSAYHKSCVEALDESDSCTVHEVHNGRKKSVFGSSVQSQATEKIDGVPIIVRRLSEVLERTAIDHEGLYRLSGVKSQVESLCSLFESNPRTVCIDDENPIVLAAVMKLYLRQLTKPLIAPDVVAECLTIGQWRIKNFKQSNCEMETAIQLSELMGTLPHVNFNTLAFLCAHLQRVSYHHEQNKMAAKNLGIVFGPTLLPSKADSLEHLMQMPVQSAVVEIMIKHCESVFVSYFETRPAQRPSTYEKILESSSEGNVGDRRRLLSKSQKKRFSASMISDHANEVETGYQYSAKSDFLPPAPVNDEEELSSSDDDDDDLILGFPDESAKPEDEDGSSNELAGEESESETKENKEDHELKLKHSSTEQPRLDEEPVTSTTVMRRQHNRHSNRISGKIYDTENSPLKAAMGKMSGNEDVIASAPHHDESAALKRSSMMMLSLSMDEPTTPPPLPPGIEFEQEGEGTPEMETLAQQDGEEGESRKASITSVASHAELRRQRYSSYGVVPDTLPPPPPPEEDDEENDREEEEEDTDEDNNDGAEAFF
eukprot:m.92827 g.92827  ORF g.92827 m.92827 type:complete len:1307 (+) comp8901_c0_seq6:69-3989(+)